MEIKLEPLIKELKCDDCGAVYANVIRTWDLKERIEWWKKYRDKIEKLMEEYPNYKQEICEVFKCVKSISLTDFMRLNKEVGFDSGYWLDYDLWLLNKAFEDVVKKD